MRYLLLALTLTAPSLAARDIVCTVNGPGNSYQTVHIKNNNYMRILTHREAYEGVASMKRCPNCLGWYLNVGEEWFGLIQEVTGKVSETKLCTENGCDVCK